MNGLARIFIGLYWIACVIYGATHINPSYGQLTVIWCSVFLALMALVGLGFISTGINKLQRGE